MNQKNKKDNPVKLLLSWTGKKNKAYLAMAVLFAFLSGLFVIGTYMGIYQLMDAILGKTVTKEIVVENIVLITASTVFRMVFLAFSGVLSHKGAYGALFDVRCMITDHLAQVPLGYLDERSTGEMKTILNEDIEKLELCLAHNIPELVCYLTGPLMIFIYLMTVNVPLALLSLLPIPLGMVVMMWLQEKF